MTRRGIAAAVAVAGLIVGCGDDGDDDASVTTGPDTTEPDEVSLSEVCTDLSDALDQLASDIGDIDSVDDLSELDDVVADAVDRVEDAAGRLDDVEAQGEDEQAVVDALDEASSSAGRIGDEITDGDLDAARQELDATGDALDEARERAADADVDCSV